MPLKTTKKTRRNARAPVSRYISRAEQTSLAYVAYLDLIEVAEYLRGEMAGQLANFDLTTAEYGLLEAVFRNGPQFQEPLREKLRCSKQHVSRVVERLERAGYVRRRASSLKPAPEQRWVNPKEAASVDRPRRGHRIRMVKLTPAGEETMRADISETHEGGESVDEGARWKRAEVAEPVVPEAAGGTYHEIYSGAGGCGGLGGLGGGARWRPRHCV